MHLVIMIKCDARNSFIQKLHQAIPLKGFDENDKIYLKMPVAQRLSFK